MDIINQSATYRREVLISDTNGPVDPTNLLAVMCPETPMAITQQAPGDYIVSLEAADTALLLPGSSHWELWGDVGSDTFLLTRQDVVIRATCKEVP